MLEKKSNLKRLAALILALAAVFALTGCRGMKEASAPIEISDPTAQVTACPTAVPTEVPTEAPTEEPTEVPTEAPTEEPTEEPTAEPTVGPTEAVNPGGARKVYITVDDGPWTHTDELLDLLARYNIKATFFTVGKSIKSHPDLARRIVDEGHCLGCHSMTHEYSSVYASPEAFVKEAREWRELVKSVVGYDAGAYVFRFPGGSDNKYVKKELKSYLDAMHKEGYIAMDWNLALNDKWLAGNTDNLPLQEYFWQSYTTTYSWYHKIDPLILIMHDTEYESIKILPRILDDLIAKGFEFGTCDELEKDYIMWNYKG